MSVATATAPREAPEETPSVDADAEWLCLADAARLMRCHQTSVMRLALSGLIQHKIRRGRTLFHAGDCRDAQ